VVSIRSLGSQQRGQTIGMFVEGMDAVLLRIPAAVNLTQKITRACARRERHSNIARLQVHCLQKEQGAVACRSEAKSAALCIPQ